MTEASEFDKIYKLGVDPHPHQPADGASRTSRTSSTARSMRSTTPIIDDIAERHAEGPADPGRHRRRWRSPRLLSGPAQASRGIPHTVLERQASRGRGAQVVAHVRAQAAAVTVATNMAGRGTDIMLGGSVGLPRRRGAAAARVIDPVEHVDEYEAAWPAMHEQMKDQVQSEHDEVNDIGGLYVVGTERHESRRIDNQLRGRSGRQGDPGESRFYLSLERRPDAPVQVATGSSWVLLRR